MYYVETQLVQIQSFTKVKMEHCGVSQAQQEGCVKLVLPELTVALIGSSICFNAQFLILMFCKKKLCNTYCRKGNQLQPDKTCKF